MNQLGLIGGFIASGIAGMIIGAVGHYYGSRWWRGYKKWTRAGFAVEHSTEWERMRG